jgi:hypothetical protein
VKDGAHSHGSGGSGLGLAVAIGAGALLAQKMVATITRVLPVLVTGAAVIAGLAIAGWVTRAVLLYRREREAARCRADLAPGRLDQLDGSPAARDLAAARRVPGDLQAHLAAADTADRPGLVRHEHLHFHGLAAEQVAAILAARQRRGGED